MKTPRHLPASRMTAAQLRKALAVSKKQTRDATRLAGILAEPKEPVTILEKAATAVFGAREDNYSHPRVNFARIARRFTAALAEVLRPGAEVDEGHVTELMIQIKLARLESTPAHADSLIDIAGYAECGARVVGIDE